jgi:hypothetical protein
VSRQEIAVAVSLVLWVSGCVNVANLRTGRVTPQGEFQMHVAAAATIAPEPVLDKTAKRAMSGEDAAESTPQVRRLNESSP